MGWSSRSDRSAPECRDDTPLQGGTFPLWIALGSTTLALALFFSTTVPTITEMRFLRGVAFERVETDRRLSQELDRDALHQVGLECDIQSLLVELDKRGIPLDSILSKDISDATGEDGQAPR